MRLLLATAIAVGALAPVSAAPNRAATGQARAVASAKVGGSWLGVFVDGREALITDVLPKTPAAKSGLQAGDRVLAVGATRVGSAGDLIRSVSALKPGTAVDIKVRRLYQSRPVILQVVVEA
ncbi:MAG: PDZ domain-containing protein, partial [Deltaproteobacteria bacterium]|nr:PDZ domain-containing protein [Deltaproteobacteria bacterium]